MALLPWNEMKIYVNTENPLEAAMGQAKEIVQQFQERQVTVIARGAKEQRKQADQVLTSTVAAITVAVSAGDKVTVIRRTEGQNRRQKQ